MGKSLNFFFSLQQEELLSPDEVDAQEGLETQNSFIVISSDNDEDIDKINPVNRVINKRKFNRFIEPYYSKFLVNFFYLIIS